MSKDKSTRPARIPVSSARDILTVHGKDPNFEYRWVLDDPKRPGRLTRFKDGGWEVVTDADEVGQTTVDRGKKLGSAITRPDGAGTLVLMRISKEWYDEDQAAKASKIDDLERSMLADEAKEDGRYGKIDIQKRRVS